MVTQSLPRGVRQRGNSFLVDVTHKGARATATVHDIDAVEQKRVELLHSLMTGKKVGEANVQVKKPWTVQEALDYTVLHVWGDMKAAVTLKRNGEAAAKHFGKTKMLSAISVEDMDGWVEDLMKGGNANATINRKLAALSKIMSVARDRGRLTAKPKFPRKKESQGRIRFLPVEEEKVLLSLVDQWGFADELDAFTVLVDTGLRVGELLRLQPRDCEKMINVWETKADKPRSVPMTKRVQAIIERRSAGLKPTERLFNFPHHRLRHVWDRAKGQMGLGADKQFVPHALRHTCCSRLVQRGINLRIVQQWMGHKTLAVTMRYAHLAPTDLADAAAALEQPE